jgi:hypothetical protein
LRKRKRSVGPSRPPPLVQPRERPGPSSNPQPDSEKENPKIVEPSDRLAVLEKRVARLEPLLEKVVLLEAVVAKLQNTCTLLEQQPR